MNNNALIELTQQVRGYTLSILAAAPENGLTWAPAGLSNHVLWHAGHALWVLDVLGVEPLTGRSELPVDWEATFGMDCKPVRETQQWPARSDLAALLAEQQTRFIELLRQTPPATFTDPKLLFEVVHGLHDEAKHSGEMYLLVKMFKAQASSKV